MQQFMHGMQQQIAAQQPVPIHQSGVSHRLDERWFRRLDRFSNKNDDWKEWRLHFLTVFGECNSKFGDFLKENERKDDPIDSDLEIPP